MSSLAVVSWNIDARGDRLSDRLQGLADFGVDLVLLQEGPRQAAATLQDLPGLEWAALSLLHSEPDSGASSRIGTAILGNRRVTLRAAGQIDERHFIDYRAPGAHGSDHGAIIATLTMPAP